MGEARLLFAITIVLGLVIDAFIFSLTRQLWSELVHNIVVEQAKDAELANRIVLYVLDFGMAMVLMGGIGILLAAAVVYPAYYRLTGRR